MGGSLDASAPHGQAGKALLDPHSITIATDPAGGLAYFELVDPHPAGGNSFGIHVVPLSGGNIVVTSQVTAQVI